jgi:hypothetical protein
MARLCRQGDVILREDAWPTAGDLGRPMILAGGEVEILRQWWNAPDESEWCWSMNYTITARAAADP